MGELGADFNGLVLGFACTVRHFLSELQYPDAWIKARYGNQDRNEHLFGNIRTKATGGQPGLKAANDLVAVAANVGGAKRSRKTNSSTDTTETGQKCILKCAAACKYSSRPSRVRPSPSTWSPRTPSRT